MKNAWHQGQRYTNWVALLCGAAAMLGWSQHSVLAGAPTATASGSYKGPLLAPGRVALDSAGNAYVTDPQAGRVVVLNETGGVVAVTSGLAGPLAIAVKAGNIYVGEADKGCVTVYDSSWILLGKLGSGDGEFLLPGHIAVDPGPGGSDVYVCDSRAHQIKVYSSSRTSVTNFGARGTGPGQFDFPSGVFVSASGEVFVVDQNNDRVQVFDRSGGFLRQFPLATPDDLLGINIKSGRSQGITGDDKGNIYVTDTFQGQVKVFDTQGNFLLTIGQFGKGVGELRSPVGVAVGAGRLFVASANNGRVELFDLTSAGVQFTLIVDSAFGGAYPGNVTVDSGTLLIQSVTNSPIADGVLTQYVCAGWALAGNTDTNSMGSGAGTNVALVLTNNATLIWQWQTNYTFTASGGPNGLVEGSGNGWYALGSSVTVTGVPNAYYHFAGWSGNVQGDTSSAALTLPIDMPRSIVAAFLEDLAPGGTPDLWLAQYGLTNGGSDFAAAETNDADGDGSLNGQEYIAGTDPTNSASYFRIVAVSNRTASILYFQSVTGRIYSLFWKTNLMSGAWTNVPGVPPIQGSGDVMLLGETNSASPRYYRLNVQKP